MSLPIMAETGSLLQQLCVQYIIKIVDSYNIYIIKRRRTNLPAHNSSCLFLSPAGI